jgi:ABC-type Zn uptake system ZnuABC Zn-binding protein ZnuA
LAALIYFKLRKAASEMHRMLKTAFGSSAIVSTQTFEWFFRYKYGVTSVEVCEHSGHPSSGHTGKNMEKVSKIIDKDH